MINSPGFLTVRSMAENLRPTCRPAGAQLALLAKKTKKEPARAPHCASIEKAHAVKDTGIICLGASSSTKQFEEGLRQSNFQCAARLSCHSGHKAIILLQSWQQQHHLSIWKYLKHLKVYCSPPNHELSKYAFDAAKHIDIIRVFISHASTLFCIRDLHYSVNTETNRSLCATVQECHQHTGLRI